jgi:hypothetical protein
MLSKCANPACSTTFRYLHEGKLFHLVVASVAAENPENPDNPVRERFWLCDECSKKMKVISTRAGVTVVPLESQPDCDDCEIAATPWDFA